MNKYPSDWGCYIRYDLPVNLTWFHIKPWVFQLFKVTKIENIKVN